MVAGAVLRGLQPHHRHLLHHLHQALQDPGEKEVETGLKHTGEESHRKKSNGRRLVAAGWGMELNAALILRQDDLRKG